MKIIMQQQRNDKLGLTDLPNEASSARNSFIAGIIPFNFSGQKRFRNLYSLPSLTIGQSSWMMAVIESLSLFYAA